jgi:hypothetical protein
VQRNPSLWISVYAALLRESLAVSNKFFREDLKVYQACTTKQRVSSGSSGKNYSENKILKNFYKKWRQSEVRKYILPD